ncbi:MAG: restriction endonuclease subunit S [Eubacteriales bacterium]|nr:restriction endonuclease subunit S [Eubacteriales bacterium]
MDYVMLKDVCAINMGQSPDSNSYNDNGEGVPFFQGNADFGERYPITRKWCSAPTKMAAPDDILISVRAPIGAMNYAKEACCIGRGLAALTPDKSKVSSEFIFWLLKGKNAELNSKGTGSTFKAIGRKVLEETLVPDIPLERQTECSEILESVFAVIQTRKQELQKLDELIKARFVEMFGDPVTNEKGWKTKPLLELGSCKNGMNFHYDDSGIEINCLGVGDFKDHSVITNTEDLPTVSLNEMPSEEYLLKDDDIVFVRSNGNKALVGRSVAVYPGEIPTTFSGFCIRFRKTDETVLVPYLLRVLKSDSIRTKMAGRGANIQNLNQQILGSLTIPVPPIELQEQFAPFSKQLDKSKVVVQKALEEAQLLFDSLMQEYFG